MAGSRDIAQVLLSPRISGAISPRNRSFYSSKRSPDADSFAAFNYFRTGMTESSDNGDGTSPAITDQAESASCGKKPSFLEVVFCSILTNLLIRNTVVGMKTLGARKGLRQFLMYITLFMMIGLAVVKISSMGWLDLESEQAS